MIDRGNWLATCCVAVFGVMTAGLTACGTETPSTQPGDSPAPDLAVARALDAQAHPGEALLRELAGEVPGFAGLWYDAEAGEYQMSGVDPSALADKAGVARSLIDKKYPQLRGANMRQRPAKYTFTELADWRHQARAVFADKRVVGLDLDSKGNSVVVSVSTEASRADVSRILSRAGVPLRAVRIQVDKPMMPQIALTDHRRPRIENGFRIQFNWLGIAYHCTLGADAIGSGNLKGFLTNSHCGSGLTVGSTQASLYWQPSSSVTNIIGGEKYDRVPFTGGPCPSGKQCRYSDAVFVDYNTDDKYSGKRIAETTTIGTGFTKGSLILKSVRPATQSSNVLQGFVIRKTGQFSGTTQGTVDADCVDVPWGNTNILLLCQDQAALPSGPGDSGSPVYFEFSYPTATSAVYHVGILWGGNCTPPQGGTCVGNRMTFSPWSGIASDLPAWY